MMPWWAVLLIAWAAGFVGFFTAALLAAASRADRRRTLVDLWSTPGDPVPSEGGRQEGDPP